MGKINVCVIFGGKSSEHEVSLITARNVINNLNKDKYQIYPLGITKSGQWLLHEGGVTHLETGEWERGGVKAIISPDIDDKCLIKFKGVRYEKIKIDVAYLAVHGENVEDGALQGLLEISGIPYTGSGVLSSALCMDKDMSRLILRENGIPVVKWIRFCAHELDDIESVIARVKEKFDFPVFVKPSSAGSSIGVSRAGDEASLASALKNAAAYGDKILVEENIDAREIECGVIGNEAPVIAMLGEPITQNEFYTYDAKYKPGQSTTSIPADIGGDASEAIREYAEKAYLLLGCRGLCRIDFFLDKNSGKIYLNELNTLPGCTDSSAFPLLWQKSGVSFSELLDRIISYAMM